MNFLTLPAYAPMRPLDFSPVAQAVEGNRRNALAQSQLDLQRAQYDITKRQADEQFMRQKMRDDEWAAYKQNTQAHGDLPPGVLPLLIAAGPERGPDIGAKGMFDAYKSQKDGSEIEARNRLLGAQADYYRARTRDVMNPQGVADPLDDYGLDENGNAVRFGRRNALQPAQYQPNDNGSPAISRSMVLGSGATAPDSASAEHMDFGRAGTMTTNVPGLVVTPRGAASKYGTEFQQGIRAFDRVEEGSAKDRLRAARENQNIFGALYGKPPTGKAYTADGKLVDLGKRESVQDRNAVALVEQGLWALDRAKKGLDAAGTFALYAGDTWRIPGTKVEVGGLGEAGDAFLAAKDAVTALNFAMSGKSVSNAEREHFISLFMPTANDSKRRRDFKFDMIKNYFVAAMKARAVGADDEQMAAIYRKNLLEGSNALREHDTQDKKGRAGSSPAQDSRPRDNMPPMRPAGGIADQLRRKYGLE